MRVGVGVGPMEFQLNASRCRLARPSRMIRSGYERDSNRFDVAVASFVAWTRLLHIEPG